jgi:hypothetical protein
MRSSKDPVYEYACHEGNYAMVDISRVPDPRKRKPPRPQKREQSKALIYASRGAASQRGTGEPVAARSYCQTFQESDRGVE